MKRDKVIIEKCEIIVWKGKGRGIYEKSQNEIHR